MGVSVQYDHYVGAVIVYINGLPSPQYVVGQRVSEIGQIARCLHQISKRVILVVSERFKDGRLVVGRGGGRRWLELKIGRLLSSGVVPDAAGQPKAARNQYERSMHVKPSGLHLLSISRGMEFNEGGLRNLTLRSLGPRTTLPSLKTRFESGQLRPPTTFASPADNGR
jgi:hypothetical protein